MKTCKECNNEIPESAIVDGRRRSLRHRYYCLICRPIKKRGKQRPSIRTTIVDGMVLFKCSVCHESKPRTSEFFYPHGNNSEDFQGTCKQCRLAALRARKRLTKQRAVEYKGRKCHDCNGVFPIRAYDFHHLDSTQKDYEISSIASYSWKRIQPELDKCVLLCATCHRIRHNDVN